jgi:hypothetical protein
MRYSLLHDHRVAWEQNYSNKINKITGVNYIENTYLVVAVEHVCARINKT